MIGITVKPYIGIGDAVQFTSLPENYYRAKGERLIDVSRCWIFDHNPYVVRSRDKPPYSQELWTFAVDATPAVRGGVYRSNAEIWARKFEVPVILNRPRLYYKEEYPFAKRDKILFHTHGRSHGALPDRVIDHVIRKYRPTGRLFHIGLPQDPDLGIPKIVTPTVWDLAEVIASCQLFIGIDSGPAWIASCYPDVMIKKIRNLPVHGQVGWEDWIPLEVANIHSHWDDRVFQMFHCGEDDLGFMSSYKKL